MKISIILFSFALISLASIGQQFNVDYQFIVHSNLRYGDLATLKATAELKDDKFVSVGFVNEDTPRGFKDIVVTIHSMTDGSVLSSKSYGRPGYDEQAFGVTASYDGAHIILVGRAHDINNRADWNAIVMKIEIITGNVVWINEIGTRNTIEEFRLVERVFPLSPFYPFGQRYMLVGATEYNGDVDAVLFAAVVNDNDGSSEWSNIYASDINAPTIDNHAFGMVRNAIGGNFIISGTASRPESSSDIFTIGINPFSGSISDPYKTYDVNARDEQGGAICTVDLVGGPAYAIAYSTEQPGVSSTVSSAITVMKLNLARDVESAHYYWQSNTGQNSGLSIYQNKLNVKSLDVYAGTSYENIKNRLFINMGVKGKILNSIKLSDDPEGSGMDALSMVKTTTGYIAKSLDVNPTYTGMSLIGLNPDGRTVCDANIGVEYAPCYPTSRTTPLVAFGYGDENELTFSQERFKGEAYDCDGSPVGGIFKDDENVTAGAQLASNFSMYPNPISSSEAEFRISYNVEQAQLVNLQIYNALGQMVYNGSEVLNAGGDVLSIEASKLAAGINMIVLRSGDEVVFQSKVMKE